MYLKIVNPNTNRKVSIYSKIGKQVLYQYYMQIGARGTVSPTIQSGSNYVFNNRFEDIKKLYGAVGLHYYKFTTYNGITKKILLISDEHSPILEHIKPGSTDSIDIAELIVDITQSLSKFNKCVDFYLEKTLSKAQGNTAILDGGGGGAAADSGDGGDGDMYTSCLRDDLWYWNPNSMGYIRGIFNECSYNQDKPRCSVLKHGVMGDLNHFTYLDNLRVHNIDLRQKIEESDIDLMDHPFYEKINNNNLDAESYNNLLAFALGTKTASPKEDIIAMLIKNSDKFLDADLFTDISITEKYIKQFIKVIEAIKKKINKEESKYNENKIFGDDSSDDVPDSTGNTQPQKSKYNRFNLFRKKQPQPSQALGAPNFLSNYGREAEERRNMTKTLNVLHKGKHLRLALVDLVYATWKSSERADNTKGSALGAALVDIYTLLRILKNFDITGNKGKRGPEKCWDTPEQNNIIIFAGAAHIASYKFVFDNILPKDSLKYRQTNYLEINRQIYRENGQPISKILNIKQEKTFNLSNFKNYNQLMMDFCS